MVCIHITKYHPQKIGINIFSIHITGNNMLTSLYIKIQIVVFVALCEFLGFLFVVLVQ